MQRINLTVVKGVLFRHFIPLYSQDGQPENMDNDFLDATIGTWGGATVETFTTTQSIDDEGQPAWMLELTPLQTAALSPGLYRWDSILTDSGGDTIPVAFGEVAVVEYLSA